MALFQNNYSPHFRDPWLLIPYTPLATSLEVQDSAAAQQDSSTTAFFTEMARRGLQDTTNWTSDTYKTLLSVTGKGLVGAVVGPTAGGSSTTTFEFTIDGGAVTEIAVSSLASGERALLTSMGPFPGTAFTTANNIQFGGAEALDSNKQIFGDIYAANANLPPWWLTSMMGTPMLRFNQSLLIRAKHSASITNSTATAYSAIMYRLGL